MFLLPQSKNIVKKKKISLIEPDIQMKDISVSLATPNSSSAKKKNAF